MDETRKAKGPSVIVGVDGSPGATNALAWAVNHEQALGPITPVTMFHVEALIDGFGVAGEYADIARLIEEGARTRLSEATAELQPAVVERGRVVQGHAGPALVEAARDASLLVVGSRGRSAFVETLFGSVGSYCVKHSKVPVAVIPDSGSAHSGSTESVSTDSGSTDSVSIDSVSIDSVSSDSADPQSGFRRLVVGLDGSDNAEAALRWARDHVAPTGTVVAVGCWWVMYGLQPVPAPGLMADLSEETAEMVQAAVSRVFGSGPGSVDPGIEVVVEMGDPRQILADAASEADALVIGARGRRGIPHLLLGSVATSLLHHPTSPTIVVTG